MCIEKKEKKNTFFNALKFTNVCRSRQRFHCGKIDSDLCGNEDTFFLFIFFFYFPDFCLPLW